MTRLALIPNVEIVAVADIWDYHLNEGKKLAAKNAFATKDYHKLLAREDVDAVVIGSPDHWHVQMTIDAVQAGKDVYVEKPLTHSREEGEFVIAAVRATDRVVQVGTQQRSMPHIIKAREIIQAGTLGDIYKVHMTWNRNSPRWERGKPWIAPDTVDWKNFLGTAPDQPFDEYKFRAWRFFWDFGGGIFTDLMVHWIDVAYWILDWDNPSMAASIGDHFKAKDLWETPDTVQTLLKYPNQNTQAYFEGTFSNARNRAMIEFMGSKGTLYIDRGRYEIHPDPKSKLEPSQLVIGKGPRGADFYEDVDGALFHLQNWIDCIRTRSEPACPIEAGVKSAAAAHLANQSLRSEKIATWND
jgi:predicted dehydrogenase